MFLCVRSVCLLLQVALPCAVYADASSQLCLKGGTNAEMAPQIDYTVKVCAYLLVILCVHTGVHTVHTGLTLTITFILRLCQKCADSSVFVLQVFKPIVEKFGVHFDCDIRMR